MWISACTRSMSCCCCHCRCCWCMSSCHINNSKHFVNPVIVLSREVLMPVWAMDVVMMIIVIVMWLLCVVCRKKELITRSELTLPWRPFYRLISDSIYSRYERHGLVLLPPYALQLCSVFYCFITVIIVKKLHSLKRFVRTTVAASHNWNSKNQNRDIT